MAILRWLVIVSVSFSATSATTTICSNGVCQVISQLDHLSRLLEQNVEMGRKFQAIGLLDFQKTLVNDIENLLTKKFEAMESNILKEVDSKINRLSDQQQQTYDKLTSSISVITNFVTEKLRNNTEIVSDNSTKASITHRSSPKFRQTTTPMSTGEAARPFDCWDIFQAGHKDDGLQTIYPQGYETTVYCDMTTDGGGWTVFLYSKNLTMFRRSFISTRGYKLGFGDPATNYWMGHKVLHLMTTAKEYIVRIDPLRDEQRSNILDDFNFNVTLEADTYKLLLIREGTRGEGEEKNRIFTYEDGPFINYNINDKNKDEWVTKNCAGMSGSFYAGHNIVMYEQCSNIHPSINYGFLFHDLVFFGFSSDRRMKLRPRK